MNDEPTIAQGSDQRVEELLRVNARLAAEVRDLTLGKTEAPRPAAMPTARLLGRLSSERDGLLAELESTRAQLADVSGHREGLERQNQELEAEIERLRSGLTGLVRRLRGRALGRFGSGGQ